MLPRMLILAAIVGLVSFAVLLPGCDKLVTEVNNIIVVDSTLGAACVKCHTDANDSLIIVPKMQWANSAHASARYIEAAVRIDDSTFFTASCGPVCHSGNGFVDSIEYDRSPLNAQPSVINCYTCHLPHTGKYGSWDLDSLRGQFDPLIMRNLHPYGYGHSTLCAVCHQAMNPPPTGTSDIVLTPAWGPHVSPQADIYSAKGGYQFGMALDSGAHTASVMKDGCIKCHFGTGQGNDFGEHTFRLQYDPPQDTTPYLANCNVGTCHSSHPVTDFYNFDSASVIQNYLDTLRYELEVFGALDSTDGSGTKINIDSTISSRTAQLLYNYLLVRMDGTRGLHNPRFVSKLLHESVIRIDSIPPQARYVATTDTTGCAPLTVTFQNTSRGKYDSLKWDFGDNTTDSVAMPTHLYDTAGVFTVKLTIYGPGGTSAFTRPGKVLSGGVPVAQIGIPNLAGCKPTFDLVLVDSTVGLVDSVLWNINGTLTSRERTVTVPLTTLGKQPLDLSLIIWNECGADTAYRVDTALVDTLPTATFTVSDSVSAIAPLLVTFTNTTDSSRGIDSVVWNLGGARVKGWEPTNPYSLGQGVWPCFMTVYNRCGSDVSETISIRVAQTASKREEAIIESRK